MNRQELEQRRDELQQRLKAVERDLGTGLDRDLEEQAQELENRDTLLEIARVAERELRDVEAQLRELDET
ncbi:MAG: hypothetical protein R6V61_13285 [Wenzhouxiangellaceae bacterium]